MEGGRQGRAIGRRRRHRRGARPARGGFRAAPETRRGMGEVAGRARRSRRGGLGTKRRGRCPEGGAPPPPPGCGHYDYFGRQGASAATARRRGGLRSSVSRSLPQSPACAALPALGPRHQNRGVPLSDLIDRCCSLLQIYEHTQTTCDARPPSLPPFSAAGTAKRTAPAQTPRPTFRRRDAATTTTSDGKVVAVLRCVGVAWCDRSRPVRHQVQSRAHSAIVPGLTVAKRSESARRSPVRTHSWQPRG